MLLYDFFRSSAAFRVRIALNLKNLTAERRYIHLGKNEHRTADYQAVNPQGFVPYLKEGGFELAQSLAIIEYLDEKYPEPPLLPLDIQDRALARAAAQLIACDMHPVNNKRILDYLAGPLGLTEAQRNTWYRHWIAEGFTALEKLLSERGGGSTFCFTESPTLADICLVPQVFNALRFECDMAPYPRINAIHAACMQVDAFATAQPGRQPDAS